MYTKAAPDNDEWTRIAETLVCTTEERLELAERETWNQLRASCTPDNKRSWEACRDNLNSYRNRKVGL